MTIIGATWLFFYLFFAIYGVRSAYLNRILSEVTDIAPAAKKAKITVKNKALQLYTDRSQSSLECLRELTILLPAGDSYILQLQQIKSLRVRY